jgi:hypothetical protein
VCTNVPGPQFPLYLLGHKMLSWYPYVPIGGEMALNCAVLSYDGVTYFGFSGDAHAVPDLKCLEPLLQASLAEMRKSAGYRPPRAAVALQRPTRPVRVKVAKVVFASTSEHAAAGSALEPEPASAQTPLPKSA